MTEATDVSSNASPQTGKWWLAFFNGSIGSKALMAVTGLLLWLFLVGHLAGNTLIYFGAEGFNAYAHKLHDTPLLVWSVRILMLFCISVHAVTAIRTTAAARAARPVAYAFGNKAPVRKASASMALSGLIVLAFLGYHLAQFTFRATGLNAAADTLTPYDMVVVGFHQPVIVGFYEIGVALLAAHLSHGIFSLFQHLGIAGTRWTPFVKNAALVIGYGMCAAFGAIPLFVNLVLGAVK
jgi:succinate dehydrogenase / fumarate reductase cytochrome b subunit